MSCSSLTIALIHNDYSAGLVSLLAALGTVTVFADQFQLRDYLLAEKPCDLVVSAVDGALGMNVCITARGERPAVPILWLTAQKEFEPQSRRTPVDVFMVKPVALSEVVAAAKNLLEHPPQRIPEPVVEQPKPSPADPPLKKTFGAWLRSLFGRGTQPIDIEQNKEDTR